MNRDEATADKPLLASSEDLGSTDHRTLLDGEWWRAIPAWRDVSRAVFEDAAWQLKNSVDDVSALASVLGNRAGPAFLRDVERGLELAPMRVRVTPYVLGLIDWDAPVTDPLRRQFLPLGSEHEDDHPMGSLDSLAEQRDAVAPGLTHRYPDKVLFLALDVCPVYCRYCTRSYSIGADTEEVDKLSFQPRPERWEKALEYIADNEAVEDVVVSGGDLYLLAARRLRELLDRLMDIDHVRRIRVATKGLAVLPQKLISDEDWTVALADAAAKGRKRGVHVCVHTHFNHPNEITALTQRACNRLTQRGVTIRNQSVLLRGVNDDPAVMTQLVRRLAWIGVEPYYVYVHDMVPGVETLRTTLRAGREAEKTVRGQTAGFMTPLFVCDTVGGGGKRDLHSYELYDEELGVGVFASPVVSTERPFFYFDPLRTLAPQVRTRWTNAEQRRAILVDVARKAGFAAWEPKA